MKLNINTHRGGFTLVELITAMAVTALLVTVIMQLTNQGIALWEAVRQDVSTTTSSRVALQTMARDLQSYQMRSGNRYEWFFAATDEDVKGGKLPKGLDVPASARCVFFACAPDRNPSVASAYGLRSNYRTARSHNKETQGDVNTIGYRLMYRDQILDRGADSPKDGGLFPTFSLYRQVISPRNTYDHLLCKQNLEQAYERFEEAEESNFLCENIIELSLILNVQYIKDEKGARQARPSYASVSVPILSTRGKKKKERSISVYGDRIEVNGKVYRNARIQSANISMTVLTQEGVNLVEQVRLGRRRAPKPDDFFNRYTRSYSTLINLPQPL